MRGLVLSAPSSGQGKTVLTLGLLRALRNRGVAIASAKSGPDYIDPAFHQAATGRPCATLDAWATGAMGETQLRARARQQTDGAEVILIEGAMGLFDGAATGGRVGAGATSALATTLGLPVVLIIDAARMGQSAGAVIEGFRRWDPTVEIAGVILNRVGSARHEAMIRVALDASCPVIGVVPRETRLTLPSRHLGLVQAGETEGLERFIADVADLIATSCDIDRLLGLCRPLPAAGTPVRFAPPGQKIAVARDLAFSFCYGHLLSDWHAGGAEIRFFSPLANQPPDGGADAIYLPGGYPELHAARLARADRFRSGMVAARDRGAVIYGECGGYMTLGKQLIDADGAVHEMLGLLDLVTSFAERQRHLGYRAVQGAGIPGNRFRAHEFHYASTIAAAGQPLFEATDSSGAALAPMGLIRDTVSGSFAHLIDIA